MAVGARSHETEGVFFFVVEVSDGEVCYFHSTTLEGRDHDTMVAADVLGLQTGVVGPVGEAVESAKVCGGEEQWRRSEQRRRAALHACEQ